MREIHITSSSKSLSEYLQSNFPLLKFGTLNKLLRNNKIKVNGKKIPLNSPLKKGDVINLYVEDSLLEKPTKETAFKFSGKMLDIIYEDDNLLVVNKPAGISVNSENWQEYDTLENRARNHYYLKGDSTVPALCHRLDTGTQGVVLMSKNDAFTAFMLEQFKDKALKKEYVCVVKGMPKQKKDTYTAYLTKNSSEGYVTVGAKPKNNSSKEIETRVSLIECYNDYSLLKIGLITGRTHQIRAHLAYLGMPILGDSRYGINSLNRRLKMKYQALCSQSVTFGEISDSRYSYLSGKTFSCPDPWFVESFRKREF